MTVVQTHLDGSETPLDEFEFVRPSTWLYHPGRDQWHLRSRVPYFEGEDWLTYRELQNKEELLWGSEFTEEDTAGHWFDVTSSVETVYRFWIPAYSKHRAKEIAEERCWDASPVDSHVMHTKYREVRYHRRRIAGGLRSVPRRITQPGDRAQAT